MEFPDGMSNNANPAFVSVHVRTDAENITAKKSPGSPVVGSSRRISKWKAARRGGRRFGHERVSFPATVVE